MKHLIALLVFTLLSFAGFAQEDTLIDNLTVRRPLQCFDRIYSAYVLIPQLHASGKNDTLSRLIRNTRENCPYIDNGILAFEILHAIEKRSFSEQLYSDVKEIGSFYFSIRGYRRGGYDDSVRKAFETYVTNMAASLSGKSGLSPLEHFLVSYYAADNINKLDELQSGTYDGTALKALYIKDRKWQSRHSGTYGEILGGAWLPIGDLSLLGVHPGIGFEAGIQGRRLRVGLNIIFYFLNSPNSYLVQKDNIIYNTRHFFGGFMGLVGTYDLIVKKKADLGLIGGLGYCGFDALSVGSEPNHIARSINSFALKTGPSYRHYFRGGYIGLSAEYNYVSFRNKGGTTLSGQPFTVTLHLGLTERQPRKLSSVVY